MEMHNTLRFFPVCSDGILQDFYARKCQFLLTNIDDESRVKETKHAAKCKYIIALHHAIFLFALMSLQCGLNAR